MTMFSADYGKLPILTENLIVPKKPPKDSLLLGLFDFGLEFRFLEGEVQIIIISP